MTHGPNVAINGLMIIMKESDIHLRDQLLIHNGDIYRMSTQSRPLYLDIDLKLHTKM